MILSRIRRFGFRLLYNEFAFSYDRVSHVVSFGHWKRWQRSVFEHVPDLPGGHVLELAHGTGDLQIDLIRAGYSTIALDRSPYMQRITQRKFAGLGLRANLARGNAGHLPFQGGSFAVVVCTFPTSFIFEANTLLEIRRVLNSSGRAVIVLAGICQGGGLSRRLIRGLYRLTGQSSDFVNENGIREVFDYAGFEVDTFVESFDGSAAQLVILTKLSGAR